MKKEQTIGIKESFNIIKKSANPISPVIEGLINSLDSIKQRQDLENNFTPYIILLRQLNILHQSCMTRDDNC